MTTAFELHNKIKESKVHQLSACIHNIPDDKLITLKMLIVLELNERKNKGDNK